MMAAADPRYEALEKLQAEYGDRYWIRCCGRMWIATAWVDDDTEPTLIRESPENLAALAAAVKTWLFLRGAM